MPAFSRAVLVAFAALSLTSTSLAATLSPRYIPNADYGASSGNDTSLSNSTSPSDTPSASTPQERGVGIDILLGRLTGYRKQILSSSNDLQSLASLASSKSHSTDTNYIDDCVASVNVFHDGLTGYQGILQTLGADRGLANYDDDNQLETNIKDVVNSVKDSLSSIDCFVYSIPSLGPTLGPIVYEIKCILEYILDFVENAADGKLNELSPLLGSASKKATGVYCGLDIDARAADICL